MMDRSVPSAEVVKAIRSLVTRTFKKNRSDRGPKWPRTEVDVISFHDKQIGFPFEDAKIYRVLKYW